MAARSRKSRFLLTRRIGGHRERLFHAVDISSPELEPLPLRRALPARAPPY